MNATVGAAAHAAFAELIDYAGLFPPAQLSMEAAVAEYADARAGGSAWMLGRFIVPASRIGDVIAAEAQRGSAASPPLSVIVDAGTDPRRWFTSLQTQLAAVAAHRADTPVAVLEVPLPAPVSSRETFEAPIAQLRAALDRAELGDLPVFVEPAFGPRWSELLDGTFTALARARFGAKIRCGGVVAEAFPTVDAVADFISDAAAHRIAYKATAGLHHPVRHRDAATGFVMHGFLNLLAAAVFAPLADRAELREIVAEEDAGAFTFSSEDFHWRHRRASVHELERMRAQAFVGYGSCSFSEPVDDLTALGMLPAALA